MPASNLEPLHVLVVTLHPCYKQRLDCMQLPAGACAKVRTSKAVYAASSTATTSTRKVTHLRCDDDDDGEQSACNTPQQAAEFAKERGNVLYQQAQYQQAISLYSVSTSELLKNCAA